MLLHSGIELECRTTAHWRDFSPAGVERLAHSLAGRGIRHYVLQAARGAQHLDAVYSLPVEAPPSALENLVARPGPRFESLALRN